MPSRRASAAASNWNPASRCGRAVVDVDGLRDSVGPSCENVRSPSTVPERTPERAPRMTHLGHVLMEHSMQVGFSLVLQEWIILGCNSPTRRLSPVLQLTDPCPVGFYQARLVPLTHPPPQPPAALLLAQT